MQAVLDNLDEVLKGFSYTIFLFLVCAVASLVLGTILVAMRVGPIAILRSLAAVYVSVVRNTPLILIFIFFHFAAPILGINFRWVQIHVGGFDFTSAFATAFVALSLYTACFVCEGLRSGVNAVPLGQAEAARAIGLPFGGVMTQVVLPQAIRASVPPVASALIAMVKNTSVAGVFFLAEALAVMRGLTNDNASQRFGIFLCFAIGYIVIVEVVSLISLTLERRWRTA
ncbi:amino acid ABC transporter permease [Nocardioides sp. W3-2-3]|uniref:amino acid ABC transporter permease n=1 Tax=Nocardioides convexus TaxID=2712224 RepID=UPI002418A8D6|nr:amino acid ABC transporter permease [Nocardioides convexus]NHA00543.1 amino acid ABC transporter permease [Nocardioides convexus]